jgi:hypothetical protein
MSATSGSISPDLASQVAIEVTLREVVETLAPIDRPPCSSGERAAAEWLYARLGSIEGIEAELEDEPSWGTFPPTATGLGLAGPLATLAGSVASLVGGLSFLGAPRGRVRARVPARAGLVLGVLGTALVADVWRSETVQGANDNLSGAASLVALAELLREQPIPGLRVLLVSCGAEETLQDGIRAFLSRHRHELDPASTRFVNLDTVGSPHLVLLEAEGPVRMEEYAGPWLRDLFADRARMLGLPLLRGYRARASTDSVIPSRAGYPTATLVSMTDWLSPANYHLPTDIPANLDYSTVAGATRLVYEVALALAAAGGSEADGREGDADGRGGDVFSARP